MATLTKAQAARLGHPERLEDEVRRVFQKTASMDELAASLAAGGDHRLQTLMADVRVTLDDLSRAVYAKSQYPVERS